MTLPFYFQCEDPLAAAIPPKMVYHRSYSSTHHLPAAATTGRPTSYVPSSAPTAVPAPNNSNNHHQQAHRLPAAGMALQSELAMVLRERHYRGEGDIFSSSRDRGGGGGGGGKGYHGSNKGKINKSKIVLNLKI